jgi:hypothetical protein
VRKLVAAGKAATVSAFVKRAVGVALQDVAGWGVVLAEALEQTGGRSAGRCERDFGSAGLYQERRREQKDFLLCRPRPLPSPLLPLAPLRHRLGLLLGISLAPGVRRRNPHLLP